jgi:hypothetical protein
LTALWRARFFSWKVTTIDGVPIGYVVDNALCVDDFAVVVDVLIAVVR